MKRTIGGFELERWGRAELDRIAALEADNRRLRAIVQQWIDWPSVPPVPNAVMRAALEAKP